MPANTVLVVDDSPSELQSLKNIVEDAGYQVYTASNGGEAIEKAKVHQPDIILMDGDDGFETCRKITNDHITNNIPVYFVTSKSQKADRVWGELQGGKGMISKPYTPDQILETISSI